MSASSVPITLELEYVNKVQPTSSVWIWSPEETTVANKFDAKYACGKDASMYATKKSSKNGTG